MDYTYYQLPLDFTKLAQKNTDEIKLCSVEKSIAQNIYLMITSRYKERRFDETFGCEVWDIDFEMVNTQNWLEKVKASILTCVAKHEPRLYAVEVEIAISQEETTFWSKNTTGIKKKLTITVNGKIKQTGANFPFKTNMYLSPISLD
jgi:phage baseplate assembly protein W